MKRFQILTASLLGLSLSLLLCLLLFTQVEIAWRVVPGLALFLLVYLISESQPLELPGTLSRITISGLCTYALIALFPPLYAGLVGILAVLLVEIVLERKPFLKVAFNSSEIFLSIVSSAIVYSVIVNTPVNAVIPLNVLALSCAILTYFVVNTSLVSIGISQLTGLSFWQTWIGNYRWELIYVIGSIPVALLLILTYERLWIAGPLLFIAPLFLLRESYAQYIRLKATYIETVRTLIKVIETHDTYTAGHSLRVAEYAKRLAISMKLSMKEVERIEIAAYLHDLGKVDLAITHLVRKPGRLTPEEKRRVQLHPLVSADIAAQVTFFKGNIENIIRHHHEQYDGSGYPHGLRGDEIPLGSRIILIADAFDAMTSNRMYRSALDLEKVKEEFGRYSGTQFDPYLVTRFFSACVSNESMLIPQVDLAFEELVSNTLQEAMVVEGALLESR